MADGKALLGDFLTRNDLAQADCARAIQVSHVTVHGWLTGKKGPSPHHRDAIAVWTRNEVPASSWPTAADERAKVGAVQPFVPSPDASGEHHAVEPANDDDELAPEDRDASNDDDAA